MHIIKLDNEGYYHPNFPWKSKEVTKETAFRIKSYKQAQEFKVKFRKLGYEVSIEEIEETNERV